MRIFRLTILASILGMLLVACGQSSSNNSTSSATTITPVFAFSEAVVGKSRMPIGILKNGTPVNDPGAKVHLRFFDLSDTSAATKAETDAIYYGQGLPAAVYVAYMVFDKPGDWGVEVSTQLTGEAKAQTTKLRLSVQATSSVPAIGTKAISTKTLTVADVPDPKQLTSDGNPDLALYQISLDQALTNGKPTALFFGTPSFCRTAVCGPGIKVLQGLAKEYGSQVNFIHVEVYRYPFSESFEKLNQAAQKNSGLTADDIKASFSDPMIAWGLTTEPWLFLIDAKGTIVGRYEGGITTEELTPIMPLLIAGEEF